MKEEVDQRFFAKNFRERNGRETLKIGFDAYLRLALFHCKNANAKNYMKKLIELVEKEKFSIKKSKGHLTIMSDEGISIVYYDRPARHGKIVFVPFDKKRKKDERIT